MCLFLSRILFGQFGDGCLLFFFVFFVSFFYRLLHVFVAGSSLTDSRICASRIVPPPRLGIGCFVAAQSLWIRLCVKGLLLWRWYCPAWRWHTARDISIPRPVLQWNGWARFAGNEPPCESIDLVTCVATFHFFFFFYIYIYIITFLCLCVCVLVTPTQQQTGCAPPQTCSSSSTRKKERDIGSMKWSLKWHKSLVPFPSI